VKPSSRLAFGIKLVLSAAVLVFVILSSGLMAQSSNAGCIAEHYRVIPLPLLPTHINEDREIVGSTEGRRAAMWTEQSGLREVPLPAGLDHSEGIAMNNSGQIAGVAFDRTYSKHQAFTFVDGVLVMLPGEQSRPYSISDSGEVVGESLLPGKPGTRPVFWSKKTLQALGGCCGGAAKSVNNRGDVIGDVYDEAGRYHAFLWNANRGMQTIGPPDRYSSAIALNNYGHVVLTAFPDVFLYAGGSPTHLELSPRYPSQPHAINDCDVVVGSFGPFADAERAFIWEKSRGFRDLNANIPSNSGWKLESATGINNHGEIVGRADYNGRDDTGFLLIPDRW